MELQLPVSPSKHITVSNLNFCSIFLLFVVQWFYINLPANKTKKMGQYSPQNGAHVGVPVHVISILINRLIAKIFASCCTNFSLTIVRSGRGYYTKRTKKTNNIANKLFTLNYSLQNPENGQKRQKSRKWLFGATLFGKSSQILRCCN